MRITSADLTKRPSGNRVDPVTAQSVAGVSVPNYYGEHKALSRGAFFLPVFNDGCHGGSFGGAAFSVGGNANAVASVTLLFSVKGDGSQCNTENRK